jgi:4-hydroxy-tetrahydrodipicolinate synthase
MIGKHSVKVISITPFTRDGALDEAAFRRQLGRFREAGVTTWVGGSGSGEGYTLSDEERDQVLAIAVEELKGRAPVQAMGCEPRTTQEMVAFLQAAERSKVDGAQIFSLQIGHTTVANRKEMQRYYETALDSTSLPLYLSSHRAAGYTIPLDLVEHLAGRYPNLAGIAYSGSDLLHFAEMIARFSDHMEVHCAGPVNALTALGLGGNGFMGGEGNFSPRMVADVIAAWQENDKEKLKRSFAILMAFGMAYKRFGEGSAARGLKPLMNAYGLPGGYLRLPRIPIEDAELSQMIAMIKKIPIPGIKEEAAA